MEDERRRPTLVGPQGLVDHRAAARLAIGLAALCLAGPAIIVLVWVATGTDTAIVDLPVALLVLVVVEVVAIPIAGTVALFLASFAAIRGEPPARRLALIAFALLAATALLAAIQLANWA